MWWTTFSTPVITLKATGNIGIGNTAPAEKLDVLGNIKISGIYPYIDLYSSTWGAHTYLQTNILTNGGGGGDYLGLLLPAAKGFFVRIGTTNPFIINSAGSVGIGTTDPANVTLKIYKDTYPLFTLADNSGRVEIGLAQTNGDYAPWTLAHDAVLRKMGGSNSFCFNISNDNNDGNSYFKIGDNLNGAVLSVYNNAKVTVNGKLGIGTTLPNKKLEVNTAHAVNIDDEIRIGSYYLSNFYGLGLNYRINSIGTPSYHIVEYICCKWLAIQSDKMGLGQC